MRRTAAYRLALVVVIVSVCLSIATPASSAWWTGNRYYSIYYQQAYEYTYITRLQPYLNDAFLSAYRVLGNRGWIRPIGIRFYTSTSWEDGYAPDGANTVYLNLYNLYSKATTAGASILSHETSHVLFGNHTKAAFWASRDGSAGRNYLYSFLTESLAYYTGDVVFPYGKRYSLATMRANLNYYARLTGRILSWTDTARIYGNSQNYSAALFQQAWWQFHAQGYYLAYKSGYWTNPQLVSLLDNLKTYASYSNAYLQSPYYSVALSWFEYSFKRSYGSYANANWDYGSYWNTAYLYGKGYSWWYN